ncbi:MAG: response regulator [Candidatus Omnitrophota bacterium]|nr:response regulator [Candidatus Omnitrophota bacterium]
MGKRILIIEDTEVDLIIIKHHLIRAGYNQIITSSDASEGVKKAIEEKPDLIISDTLLPDSNGFEVCLKIREAFNQAGPKVIIMTGSADAVDAVKARRVGADDYCAKSSDCAMLLEAVKRLIG